LKEDIDKSRGTFQKRYGSTAAASADYFYYELLRSLAEDDVSSWVRISTARFGGGFKKLI